MNERRLILCSLIGFYAISVCISVFRPQLTAAVTAASGAATALTSILVRSPPDDQGSPLDPPER